MGCAVRVQRQHYRLWQLCCGKSPDEVFWEASVIHACLSGNRGTATAEWEPEVSRDLLLGVG